MATPAVHRIKVVKNQELAVIVRDVGMKKVL